MTECVVCGAIAGGGLDLLNSVISSAIATGVGVITVVGIVAGTGVRTVDEVGRAIDTFADTGVRAAEGVGRGVGNVANRGARAAEGARDAFWAGYDRSSPNASGPGGDPWWLGTEGAGAELGRAMGGQGAPPGEAAAEHQWSEDAKDW